jgi:uncharacterized repeat protein (TIGR03843 family)
LSSGSGATLISVAETLDLLEAGEVEVLGLLPYSSNYVFLARVAKDGLETLAVYKPTRGERPLWDFPTGTLAAREVAAYLVGRASGWDLVPPTVLRKDAPLGPGSLQLYIEHDPERHFFVLAEERLADLIPFAAFDIVINNADRKAGHVIEDERKRLWAVDHGLSFNVEPKLRTVIWTFADHPLDAALKSRLQCLRELLADSDGLGGELATVLSRAEARATLRRVDAFLAASRFPYPGPGHHHLPWPLV